MAIDIEAVRKKLEEERTQLLARSIPPPEIARGDEVDMAAMEQAKERSRMEANPLATLCIEDQAKTEKKRK